MAYRYLYLFLGFYKYVVEYWIQITLRADTGGGVGALLLQKQGQQQVT